MVKHFQESKTMFSDVLFCSAKSPKPKYIYLFIYIYSNVKQEIETNCHTGKAETIKLLDSLINKYIYKVYKEFHFVL